MLRLRIACGGTAVMAGRELGAGAWSTSGDPRAIFPRRPQATGRLLQRTNQSSAPAPARAVPRARRSTLQAAGPLGGWGPGGDDLYGLGEIAIAEIGDVPIGRGRPPLAVIVLAPARMPTDLTEGPRSWPRASPAPRERPLRAFYLPDLSANDQGNRGGSRRLTVRRILSQGRRFAGAGLRSSSDPVRAPSLSTGSRHDSSALRSDCTRACGRGAHTRSS